MIRILFDYGDSHKDLFLKVDAIPTYLCVADTYFLGDFLGGQRETKDQVVLEYLEYFKGKVQGLADHETFIIFDLSDQYIGGLFMTKGKKGLIKTKYGYSDKIEGYSTAQGDIEEQVQEERANFQYNGDWLLSQEDVLQGLQWSIARIKKG